MNYLQMTDVLVAVSGMHVFCHGGPAHGFSQLAWCWMAPACEESHWNSKNKHGKRLRNYSGPPDPNNFREVKMSGESVENEEAEMRQDSV